jgi:O-antigen/teichoic acid export membrane protein
MKEMLKSHVQRLSADGWLVKAYEWGKLFTVTGLSQLVVQSLGFVCGILVIRLLPTHEFALYVLANTMVGTLSVLADGGISTGVTSQGGKVWMDREKLGGVVATGFDLRKKFAAASLLIAIPAAILLLQTHHASWLMTFIIVLTIIISFFASLSGALLQVAPKLHQDILPLQQNQVMNNVMRLLVSTLTVTIFPFAFVAILANGLSQVWANLRLKKISDRYSDWSQKPDPAVRTEILKFVRKILPGSIYFCVSGQISIWLISMFGSTASIAQVGALSRLTMILTLLSSSINLLIVPRFARLTQDKDVVSGYYLKIQMLLLTASALFVSTSWFFSTEILWLLGARYANLETELVLATIGSCLNLVVGINYILNSSRGWLMSPLVVISAGIAGIIAGVSLIDVSTLRGVLLFNIFTGVVGLFIHPMFGIWKMTQPLQVKK